MKRVESLAIELGLLEGKEQGVKEVDRQLTKIFNKYREDLCPESANMVNDIVTMLHRIRLDYTHEINKHMILINATMMKMENEKQGKRELTEEDLKDIEELAKKLAGGR